MKHTAKTKSMNGIGTDLNSTSIQERFEEGCGLRHASPDLVEIIEWPAHPFFVGCQFHPEFRSRPNKIHPLFEAFIRASINYKE